MEHITRALSLDELRSYLRYCFFIILSLLVCVVFLVWKEVSREEIVILRTPGMADSTFKKNALDAASLRAISISLSHNVGDINRSNYEAQIKAIEPWFAPEISTQISLMIKKIVQKQLAEHEAGTQYFEFNPGPTAGDEYRYDPELDVHFVKGRMHFVNAAKDEIKPIVFTFRYKVDNYLPKVSEFFWEYGAVIKDTEFLKNLKQGNQNAVKEQEWSRNQEGNDNQGAN